MIKPLKGFLAHAWFRAFSDPASLVEILSSACLIGWAWFLFSHPDILERDTYRPFQVMPAIAWAMIFAVVGVAQVAANVIDHARQYDLRFFFMACACGLWFVVSIAFVASVIATTAGITYPVITIITALSTIWLAWKSSPRSS